MKFSLGKKTAPFISRTIAKWQIKIMLAFIAFAIVLSVILFTQALVDELISREQRIINFYAKTYKHYTETLINSAESEQSFEGYLFFLDEIIPTISFPFIMTDENDKPIEPFETWSLNIQIDSTLNLQQQRIYMQDYVYKMGKSYPPIIVEDSEGKILNKIFYTHSSIIDKLRFFPLISIIIIAAFVFVGYFAFSSVRRSEESKVWVGMAKEAAHQLGTPLSSILAWIEILKYGCDNPESVKETIAEIENDVKRLNTITVRFSKIGSMPEMNQVNICELIENVSEYFEKRLPHLGKKVEIIRNFDECILIKLNADLFAWVIENLLKNAAEAIESHEGQIYIYLRTFPGKKINIFIRDTGKGMTSQQRRQVFNPGFTTKKRGWGLGLSLCKRIIEEYHNGKIYIKESIHGKGTTFVIELPLKQNSGTA